MVASQSRPSRTPAGRETRRGVADRRIAALNELLAPADVCLNGGRPFDPVICDPRALDQILRRGTLGAGEAWMREWWDVDALDECVYRLLRAGLGSRLQTAGTWRLLLRAWLSNPQAPSRAFRIGDAHYDLGNDLFESMLDRRMVYSCGYWHDADTLDEAQAQKLDLICRKLELAPGQRLLDIGCGWGSLCRFAAENYGVSAVGVTVSREQMAYASETCRDLPVEIRFQDYRDLRERFDRIASVGMIEHVGARNYRSLFDTARRCLAPDGLFLLHTIGKHANSRTVDPWIERYIFPAGQLPSLQQLSAGIGSRFVVEDLHNFGSDYDRTLMCWYRNFTQHWPELAEEYDQTFFRMWQYYLLTCAAAFRARTIHLWQFVLSPNGVQGGYRRPE